MNILIRHQENGMFFSLLGTLTGQDNCISFLDTVRKEMDTTTKYIILDFSESSLPDSRFIGRMIELYHETKKNGIKIYLMGGRNEDVTELFKVAYLDRMMPLLQNENDLIV